DDEFIRQDIRRLFYGCFSFYDPNVDKIKEVKQERIFKKKAKNDQTKHGMEKTKSIQSQSHLNHLSPEDKKILTTAVNLWTRNLVIRQRVEDFQLGIESYQMQLNLTKPRWDAKGFEYKHDFTVIDSPRAVMFRDEYGVQMIMRFNEIYKFSDGLHKDGDADASFHFRNSDKYYHDPEECEYAGPKVTTSHEGNIPQQG
ncbi:hypothetical protein Tco_0502993, partial [Tanacetum coccineum]